jgi:hypothetical protein
VLPCSKFCTSLKDRLHPWRARLGGALVYTLWRSYILCVLSSTSVWTLTSLYRNGRTYCPSQIHCDVCRFRFFDLDILQVVQRRLKDFEDDLEFSSVSKWLGHVYFHAIQTKIFIYYVSNRVTHSFQFGIEETRVAVCQDRQNKRSTGRRWT